MTIKLPPMIQKCVQKCSIPDNKAVLHSYAKRGYRLLMCGSMLFLALSRCGSDRVQESPNRMQDMKWAYEQGQQNMRDSLKIVELRDSLKMADMYNKAAADSMKYFHSLKKCK